MSTSRAKRALNNFSAELFHLNSAWSGHMRLGVRRTMLQGLLSHGKLSSVHGHYLGAERALGQGRNAPRAPCIPPANTPRVRGQGAEGQPLVDLIALVVGLHLAAWMGPLQFEPSLWQQERSTDA